MAGEVGEGLSVGTGSSLGDLASQKLGLLEVDAGTLLVPSSNWWFVEFVGNI